MGDLRHGPARLTYTYGKLFTQTCACTSYSRRACYHRQGHIAMSVCFLWGTSHFCQPVAGTLVPCCRLVVVSYHSPVSCAAALRFVDLLVLRHRDVSFGR